MLGTKDKYLKNNLQKQPLKMFCKKNLQNLANFKGKHL